jgi:hypothetical protein
VYYEAMRLKVLTSLHSFPVENGDKNITKDDKDKDGNSNDDSDDDDKSDSSYSSTNYSSGDDDDTIVRKGMRKLRKRL